MNKCNGNCQFYQDGRILMDPLCPLHGYDTVGPSDAECEQRFWDQAFLAALQAVVGHNQLPKRDVNNPMQNCQDAVISAANIADAAVAERRKRLEGK